MGININIIDTTLREGNQAPNVRFTPGETRKIAETLSTLNIQMIEVGHPYASFLEMERVKSVTKLGLECEILAHARAQESDIIAVAESGAQWVGIFAGVNGLSQKYRLNKSKIEIFKLIRNAVAFAKSLGLKVRYTVEDSSRTPPYLLIEAYKIAIDAGADRICFADTVGILEPRETFKQINLINNTFPHTPIEVHFHDDRGLALANTLMAISAGATWISSSVNGLGERCGITDTCAIIANFCFQEKSWAYDLSKLQKISKLVAEISKSPPDPRRPIIGEYAFVHTAKLHKDSMERNKQTYTWWEEKKLA